VPTSIRIPKKQEALIEKAAARSGVSKTAFILAAVNEKLGVLKDRSQLIRELAGWLSHEDATELRESVASFGEIHPGDWD
jgi:uncharacterized protein (DUF1778 family)